MHPIDEGGIPGPKWYEVAEHTTPDLGQRRLAGVYEPHIFTASWRRMPPRTQGQQNQQGLRVAGFLVTRG